MKWFVTSDIHSFYTIWRECLKIAGFEEKNPQHGLIIAGDLFDRGKEPQKIIDFLLGMPRERLRLIRGNHEDLMDALVVRGFPEYHDMCNGTDSTVRILSGNKQFNFLDGDTNKIQSVLTKSGYYRLTARMTDYCIIGGFIITHGSLPCQSKTGDWKTATKQEWQDARWADGSTVDYSPYIKEIVIGGHCCCKTQKENHFKIKIQDSSEGAYSPYYGPQYIGIDSCVAYSKEMNVYIIDDGLINPSV